MLVTPCPITLSLALRCPIPLDNRPVPLLPIHMPGPILVVIPIVIILVPSVIIPMIVMIMIAIVILR
jgi:hypothetical protein